MTGGDLEPGIEAQSEGKPIQGRRPRRTLAIAYGITTHGLFAVAVGLMVVQLYFGLRLGWHPRTDWRGRVLLDALLLLQFPILHSFLLSRQGRGWLRRLAPGFVASDLSTTTFAAVASLQVLLAFGLWVPSGIVWWQPRGSALVAHTLLYAGAWLFLVKALWDSGLALQTGALGWRAVLRGRKPEYPALPTGGLYRFSRQPVYLGFMLTLWTGPVWTPDHLVIALTWTGYCLMGPRLKERRYLELYGDRYLEYRARVPYFLPRVTQSTTRDPLPDG